MSVNLSIPLPALSGTSKQAYFVRIVFRNVVTIASISDDANNTYVQSLAANGMNFGWYALTPVSASCVRVVYNGGMQLPEEDVCDFRALRISDIPASGLLALNFAPPGTQF